MASRLKIFHINMHHHWGGQPNRVLTECVGLGEMGYSVCVAGPKDCLLTHRAAEAGLATFDDLELRRGFHPVSFYKDYRKLKQFIKKESFDILHAHGSQDAWLLQLIAHSLHPRPSLVRTRHNTFPVAGHFLNRWHYAHFDWVITISPQVNELVSGPTGFPPDRITPIYSAPDPTRFYPRPPNPSLRQELGIAEGPIIGTVARLAPEKGHHLLLRAAAEVVKEFPNARFVCVGKGRSKQAILALIYELGIEQNVILTGFRTDVPEIEALFDIFALTPTSGESLGTSILEAFCMEKPAVVTEVGGTGESVHHGKTGYLIPPGNEEEQVQKLAGAFLELLRDSQLRERMGKAGHDLVMERFTPRILAERCAELYEKLQSKSDD